MDLGKLVARCPRPRSAFRGDKREATVASRLAQLVIPTGELELFAGSEGQRAGEVDGVVGTQ